MYVYYLLTFDLYFRAVPPHTARLILQGSRPQSSPMDGCRPPDPLESSGRSLQPATHKSILSIGQRPDT